MYWQTVEGRLLCRWTDCDQLSRPAESGHASEVIATQIL
jgi:hypothetical protein